MLGSNDKSPLPAITARHTASISDGIEKHSGPNHAASI
jgi:hypothetical protein